MQKKVKRANSTKAPKIERWTGRNTWGIHYCGCGDSECPLNSCTPDIVVLHNKTDEWEIRQKFVETWQGFDGSGRYQLTLEHAPKGAKTATGAGWHPLPKGVCMSALENIFGRPAGYDYQTDTETDRPTGLVRVLAKRVR